MTEKEQILGNLYSLRAGLSVVSVEKDKIDNLMTSAVNKRDNELKNAKNNIENAKKTFDRATRDATDLEKTLNNSLAKDDFYGECAKHFLFTLLDIFIICLAIAFVLAFVWIISGVIVMSCRPSEQISEFEHAIFDWVEKDMPDWLIWVVFILLLGSLPAAALCIIILVKVIRVQAEYTSIFSVFSFMGRRRRTKKKYSTALTYLKCARDSYAAEREAYPIKVSNAKREFVNSINRLVPRVRSLIIIINILDRTYRSLIDSRDWGNVDLIIYYFETARADSMKEALQLTDRERQAQRIIESVEMATRKITQTLNRGFSRLNATMEDGFKTISNQIYASSRMIAGKLNGIMEQNNMLSSQLHQSTAQMISATSMTNALLAKSNATSTSIAEGVDQIKGYVNQLEMLRRNGG